MRTMGSASPMLSSSSEALWRRVVVEGQSDVCVGRVCFAFLMRGGAMAADCVHGGLAYIGMSMGGTDHGAITPTPQKMERACVGKPLNRLCACVGKTERARLHLGIDASNVAGE